MNKTVSVSMIAYNQEAYIAQAIEGVVMQETSFPYELVISDDCSTDNTRATCLRYREKYPDIIRLRLQEKNLGSLPNFYGNFDACTGKYIAICEGDDYWTDPHKLQKQVDLMEKNPSLSLCFHNAEIRYENSGKARTFLPENRIQKEYTLEDIILKDWFIPTQSILFRKDAYRCPDWAFHAFGGDFTLQLMLSSKGDIGFINETMSVYRQSGFGISANKRADFFMKEKIKTLLYFNQETGFRYNDVVKKRVDDLFSSSYDSYTWGLPLWRKLLSLHYYRLKFRQFREKSQ